MKTIATIIATAVLAFSFAGTAAAHRPIPGHPYKDVCKNIPGKQTIHDVSGISARYRLDESTPRKRDCVVIDKRKG